MVKSLIWPWGQRSPTMVPDTASRGGLPTCQIWKACLERQRSYSLDTICYGCTDQFDLEVKVQGQKSPTMVRDTSSGGGLPTCQIWKAYLEWQICYSPKTICYGCRDRFDLEVKIQRQRSPTTVRDTSSGGVLPTCHIWKAYLERQKCYSPDRICYGRTHGRKQGWTDRLITIGRPPLSCGPLNIFK